MDTDSQWGWAWRGGQDNPGLCRPWLGCGIILTCSTCQSCALGGCLPREETGLLVGRRREDGVTRRTSSLPTFQDCDFCPTCGFYPRPAQTHPSWPSWGFVPSSCCGPITVWTVSHPPAHLLMGRAGVRWNIGELGKYVWGKQAPWKTEPHVLLSPFQEVLNVTSSQGGGGDSSMTPR